MVLERLLKKFGGISAILQVFSLSLNIPACSVHYKLKPSSASVLHCLEFSENLVQSAFAPRSKQEHKHSGLHADYKRFEQGHGRGMVDIVAETHCKRGKYISLKACQGVPKNARADARLGCVGAGQSLLQ